MTHMATSDCIDNYNVQYSIGHGGFGNVYKAEHRLTGQKVAIKFIEKKKIQNHGGMLKRVLQEVAIHSRLKHPSILEVYNYFEDAHYIYLILELCPHGDLNTRLKTHPSGFSEFEVRNYMQQIVEGIIYLQKHRILHRDLTLSNILISRHGTVKIADFGLATQLQDVNEKHFTMCGTPNYISPEVATRSSHGLESDVWSVGCMLYAMLTGKPPFDGQGIKGTLEKIKSGEYYLPDHLSDHAKHLIISLLQMKPEDRLKLEHILSHSFFTSPTSSIRTDLSLDSGRGTFLQPSTSTSTSLFKYKPVNGSLNLKQTSTEPPSSTKHSALSAASNILISSPHNAFNIFSSSAHTTSSLNKLGSKLLTNKDEFEDIQSDNDLKSTSLGSMEFCTKIKHLPETENTSVEPIQAFNSSYFIDIGHHATTRTKSNTFSFGELSNEDTLKNPKTQKEIFDKPDIFKTFQSALKPTVAGFSPLDKDAAKSGRLRLSVTSSKSTVPKQSTLDKYRKNQLKLSTSISNLFNDTSKKIPGKEPQKTFKFSSLENINGSKSDFHCDTTITTSGQHSIKSGVQVSDYNKTWTAVDISLDNSVQCVSKKDEKFSSESQERVKRDLFQYFSTVRLRPMRQKTKNAVITILEDGYVVAEFFKIIDNVERIKRIMKVSSDGKEVQLFETDEVVDSSLISANLSLTSDKTYHPSCLPQGWRKKFEYLSRFINLVRSKTPKITLYTGKAKCMVMENMPTPDFQADFYSGCQFTVTSDCTKIMQCDGTALMMTSSSAFNHLSPDLQVMWKHVQEAHIMCNKFEMLVPNNNSGGFIPCFPLTIGRKSGVGSLTSPNSSNSPRSSTSTESSTSALKLTSSCSENVISPTAISSKKNPIGDLPADVSFLRHKGTKKWPPNIYVRKQVSIPKTLVASELSNGTIIIKHEDHSEVYIDCKSLQIQYKETDGQVLTFKNDNCLPPHVVEKMKDLPTVMSMLQEADNVSSWSVVKDHDDCFI